MLNTFLAGVSASMRLGSSHCLIIAVLNFDIEPDLLNYFVALIFVIDPANIAP